MEIIIILCCLINPVLDARSINNSIIVNSFNDSNFEVKPVCYVVEDERQCESESKKPTR